MIILPKSIIEEHRRSKDSLSNIINKLSMNHLNNQFYKQLREFALTIEKNNIHRKILCM